ncbi:MAG: DUF6383 domain-containing protein [Porphyromonadaceae bacterium]|nr:DUF6383 domain-containing protein [Porphyromonadaceae bacterium]
MKKTSLLTLAAVGMVTAISGIAWASSPELRAVAAEAIQGRNVEQITPLDQQRPQRLPDAGYYTVPFTFGPSSQEEFNECLVVDNTTSDKSFRFDDSNGVTSILGEWNSSAAMDAYCYLPGVQLAAGQYKFSMEYKTKSDLEKFWVKIGTSQTPEGMTIDLIQKEDYSNQTYVQEEVVFTIPEDGIYYIGIHKYSDKGKWYTYMRNFTIESQDPRKPSAPEIESLDFNGEDGVFTVKAPTSSINGDALSENMTLHMLIDGNEVDGSPLTVAPGQSVSKNVNVPRGTHTFSSYVEMTVDGTLLTSSSASQDKKVTKLVTVPMAVPVNMPCDFDDFEYCTVINVDEGTQTWQTNNQAAPDTRECFQYYADWNAAANDWLIFPQINFTETGLYELTLDIATKYSGESLEVYVADEPTVEAMLSGQKVLDLDNYMNAAWVNHKGYFSVSTPGIKYVGVLANSPANRTSLLISNLAVVKGDDYKIADPQFGELSFDGSDGTVPVILPSEKFTGEPLAPGTQVSAELYIDGEKEGETLTGNAGSTVNWTVNLPRGEHSFMTKASYNTPNGVSYSEEVTTSFKVIRPSSFAYQLPLDLDLTGNEIFEDITVFNILPSSNTWTPSDQGLSYKYDSSNPADDWAITLPVNIADASKTLEFTVNAATSSAHYNEKFSVWIGTEPTVEGMTTCILEEVDFAHTVSDNGGPKAFTGTFTVPAAGKYYIGFHCTSEKNMYTLYISELLLSYEGQFDAIPATVENLAITPDPEGNNSATVAFDMPTLNAGGDALAATELTATITSPVETKTVTALPGAHVSQTVAANAGLCHFSVSVANADGPSAALTANAFIGLDTPKTPHFTAINVTEDGLGVELQWDAVTEGVNGGVINPSKLEYRITPWNDYDEDWDYTRSIYTSDTHCIFEVDADTPQDYITLGIEAFQSASTNSSVYEREVVIGKPYNEDINETFEGGGFVYGPVYTFTNTPSNEPYWRLADASTVADGEDGKVLVGTAYADNTDSGIMLPMISTENKQSAVFSFTFLNDDNTPTVEAFVGTYGLDRIILDRVDTPETAADGAWTTYSFAIPESYLLRPWIQPGIYVRFDNATDKGVIKGWNFTSVDKPNAIDGIADGAVRVNAVRGAIVITGAEGLDVTACDVAGRTLFSGSVDTNTLRIPAAAGVHTVLVNGKAFKVMVK